MTTLEVIARDDGSYFDVNNKFILKYCDGGNVAVIGVLDNDQSNGMRDLTSEEMEKARELGFSLLDKTKTKTSTSNRVPTISAPRQESPMLPTISAPRQESPMLPTISPPRQESPMLPTISARRQGSSKDMTFRDWILSDKCKQAFNAWKPTFDDWIDTYDCRRAFEAWKENLSNKKENEKYWTTWVERCKDVGMDPYINN